MNNGSAAPTPDRLPAYSRPQASDDEGTTTESTQPPAKPPRPPSDIGTLLGGVIFLLVLIGLAFFGVKTVLQGKEASKDALAKQTQTMAQTTVQVTSPSLGPKQIQLTLPGTVQANRETPVYARVSGYLVRWNFDIGAQVKAGDVLGLIDTPETDQQLAQAQAALAQNEANLQLAQTNYNRYSDLAKQKAVAQQEFDSADSDLKVKVANRDAARAEVNRLQEIESFKKVSAPFDGVITSRGVEVGNLINAGSGTAAQELFRIADVSSLRVFVNTPERYSFLMTQGVVGKIEYASASNRPVTGKITRTAGSIDPNKLTLLTELDVPNLDPTGKPLFLPGGYAEVHFTLETPHPPLVVPGNCLIFRSQGSQIAVVDPDQKIIHLRDIKIGQDLGTKLEISAGLQPNDLVVVNPSDSLTEGQAVLMKKMETKS